MVKEFLQFFSNSRIIVKISFNLFVQLAFFLAPPHLSKNSKTGPTSCIPIVKNFTKISSKFNVEQSANTHEIRVQKIVQKVVTWYAILSFSFDMSKSKEEGLFCRDYIFNKFAPQSKSRLGDPQQKKYKAP